MRQRALRAVTANFQWKAFSLLAAFLLWFALVEAPELTTSVAVPIEFKNYPSDLDVSGPTDDPIDRVQLQVRGPRDSLSLAAFARTAVVVDLQEFKKAGERSFSLENSITGLPSRVSVVRIVPSNIRLTLESHVTRTVPVNVRYVGSPPLGVRIVRQVVDPHTVVISGPASQVSRVEFVETDPLDFASDRDAADNVLEARLQTYVDNRRVRIDSRSAVDVKVYLEKIRD